MHLQEIKHKKSDKIPGYTELFVEKLEHILREVIVIDSLGPAGVRFKSTPACLIAEHFPNLSSAHEILPNTVFHG